MKFVDPYAPACCLCARSDRNHLGQRCAHDGPHQYCDEHQAQIDAKTHQPLCHARTKQTFLDADHTIQAMCAQWAIKGTTVCRRHGAANKATRASAKRNVAKVTALAKAEAIRQQRGFAKDLDPLQVLRFCLDEATNWTHIWLNEVQRISNGLEGQLIGWNHLGDQAIDIAYQCYTDALDRAARFSKLCLDAGIEERQTRVRESELELLDRAVSAMCAELGIEEQIARPIIGRHLRALPA
jgi:hypothetical protein